MPPRRRSISIALPVFNGVNYLRDALDSICAQTFTDFEVVICDNASTDETLDICQKYARLDSRFKVTRSELFLPQAENVNRAVDLCSAEWVKLFCHDDMMVPECMATLDRAVSNCEPSVGLVGNGEQWLFENGYCHRNGGHLFCLENWNGRRYLRAQLTGTRSSQLPPLPSLTTATVRKRAWLESGRFQRSFLHFDIFLWTQMLMDWDYSYIPEVLTTNRIHGTQVAVSARQSLRSVTDSRIFWSQFARQYGTTLGLGVWSRFALRNRWMGAAGTAIALQLLRRNFSAALKTFFALPIACWPWLPAFIVRSYRFQRRKIESLAAHVPMSAIYPG